MGNVTPAVGQLTPVQHHPAFLQSVYHYILSCNIIARPEPLFMSLMPGGKIKVNISLETTSWTPAIYVKYAYKTESLSMDRNGQTIIKVLQPQFNPLKIHTRVQ